MKFKDEIIARKNEIIAKKDKKIVEMQESFAKLNEAFSDAKDDFKEEELSKIPSASGSSSGALAKAIERKVRLTSTRMIQGRPSTASTSSSAPRDPSPFRVDDNFVYRAPKGPSTVAPNHVGRKGPHSQHPAFGDIFLKKNFLIF